MGRLNNEHDKEEIAVVGIGCRFPGDIVDLSSFWQAICQKKEAVSKIPRDRWNWRVSYDKDNSVIAKSFFLNASFLTQPIYDFEPLFFGMSPKEAPQCDPQQRILLEVAWEALEEGGIIPSSYAGQKVGVFVGFFTVDWMTKNSRYTAQEAKMERNFLPTTVPSTMLSARLSYFFDFCGPSFVIDTACSSSLTAIHLACQSLRNGDSDMALAGGVNLMMVEQSGAIVAKANFMSADGKSKSFDAAADGYGRGEGCGIIVLKRLKDALRDGNKIHAVISGVGINQDGHNEGLTVPNAEAQEKLIHHVARQANIQLGDISYVEAHGTGTPVGDPLEAQAISNAIGRNRPKDHPVIISSVKANIGHLEAAAGVAGLIKACLCIEHRAVPPQANLKTPNPNIPFEEMNLRLIKDEVVSLESLSKDLYVAVNSFGYGGSNANVLLRAPRPHEKHTIIHNKQAHLPSDRYILSLSTKQQASLKLTAQSYVDFLEKNKDVSLADVCYSIGRHRSFFQRHLVVIAKDKDELIANLKDYIHGISNPDVIVDNQQIKTQTKPVFVFSGMGPQWWGMGQWLLTKGPVECLNIAQECDRYFKKLAGWSILEEMRKTKVESRIHETVVAQPAIFVIQVCFATALKMYDIEPSAIVGHSVGEIAAAYVAGVLSLKDAVTVIYHRSRLQQTFAGTGGAMLAVGLSPSTAKKLIEGYEKDVAVAAINSTRSYTLSGSRENLEKIAFELDSKSEFNRFLKVELAYHNPVMSKIKQEFEDALEDIQPQTPKLPLYSTVTGRICDETFFHDADYWYRNLRQTVLFAEAITTLIHDGYTLFLEIAPHPVLSASIKECAVAVNTSVAVTYTLHRSEPEEKAIVKSLADLSSVGLELNWEKVVGGQRIDLPFYRWAREFYLFESNQTKAERLSERLNPILGNIDWAASRGWLSEININYMPWLPDHQIEGMVVLPAAAYVEAALAAHAQLSINLPKEMHEPAIIENLQLKKAMIVGQDFYPYMTWSFDDFTGRLLAYGRIKSDSAEWELYSSVSLRRTLPWNQDEVKNIQVIKNQMDEDIHIDYLYTRLSECGLEYGPAFRTIRNVYYSEKAILGYVKIAESEQDSVQDYYIHPTLLDGAFQLFGVSCSRKGADKNSNFLPIGIERVMYYGKHESALYVYIDTVRKEDDLFIGNIKLYNKKGEIVARIDGLTGKQISNGKKKEAKQLSFLYHREWQKMPPLSLLGEIARVAILTDNEQFLEPLKKELEMQGITVFVGLIGDQSGKDIDQFYHIQAGNLKDYQDFFAFINIHECRSIVYFYTKVHSIEDIIGFSLIKEGLLFAQALPIIKDTEIAENFRLVIITNGSESVDVNEKIINLNQSSFCGFVRAFAFERPELKLKLIDIDADLQTNSSVLAAEILDEQTEDDIVLRRQDRYAARLLPYTRQDNIPLIPYSQFDSNKIGFKLALGLPGVLDKIRYDAFVRQPPSPGYVELEVLATALNFKDILKIMGLLPRSIIKDTYHENGIGMEAAVKVIAVGEGAEEAGYYVGDCLLGTFKNALTSHITIHTKDIYAVHYSTDALLREKELYKLTDEDIARIKNGCLNKVTDIEASTIPIVYSTAYQTLVNLANLQKDQIVLIHAAAGGLGLAAVQVAKMCEARIFATAGSEHKRQYLRDLGCEYVWNSRNLEFVDGVKKATNGRGVDVVLNSLSGEAFHHSLELVAPFGSFCEVGKKDIAEEHWMPMKAFNENMNFFAMDLDRMAKIYPKKVVEIVRQVVLMIVDGKIDLVPCNSYPAAKIKDALRTLTLAQHIGKIVVDFKDKQDVLVKPLEKEVPSIVSDACYLITGAYGGMGLELVQWLANNGAKHLILMGRSLKEDDTNIQAILGKIRKQGIHLYQMKVDLSDRQALQFAIKKIRELNYSLKGIFHCAAVLDDGLIENLNAERIEHVLLPKAQGAWNLHDLTQDISLDYFVLFSSVTHLLGNIGQASYIAANAFLDGLAEYRRRLNLPALSIEWGAIEGGNMLKKNSNIVKAFYSFGINSLPVQKALDIMPLLWNQNNSCIMVLDMDWSKWFGMFPLTQTYSRFQTLLTLGTSVGEQTEILRALNALSIEKRLSFVVENLIQILGKTLQLPADTIDGNTRLTELGIDSLVGVELQIAISNRLGCEISLLQLMKEENLQDVGKVLLRKLKVPFENKEILTIENNE